MKKLFFIISTCCLFLTVLNAQTPEFRGAWIATTKMIDYPRAKNMTTEQLKQNYIDILDKLEASGFNAVIFQIRPAADAFFPSEYEPWSEWLTGKQGRAPEPWFDPLLFMITETHKRNMEFHAWFNPFRAVATMQYAHITENHITNKKPEWFITYDINKYFNPGIPEVRNYLVQVIMDVVNRYDIDGVHFDDYFYPYPVYNAEKKIIDFNDNSTYLKYKQNFVTIADWRRNNLNVFIKAIHDTLQTTKPNIKFGVGPGGVWRNKQNDPNGSNTKGLSTYDWLYADILTWLKNGWIDYVAPQIYWTINHKLNDFMHLTDWWANNSYNKHVYIGIGAYRLENPGNESGWMQANQVPAQIAYLRKNNKIQGLIMYRSTTILNNPLGLTDSLRTNYFLWKVPTPAMPWKDTANLIVVIPINRPDQPKNLNVIKVGKEFMFYWDQNYIKNTSKPDTSIKYVVYRIHNNPKKNAPDSLIQIAITKNPFYTYKIKKAVIGRKKTISFIVSAINKNNQESEVSKLVSIKVNRNEE